MLCVIGCGNSTRSDDGVGVVVAQWLLADLRAHPLPQVRVFDAGTGGMEVMFQARGARKLILVDACSSGSQAGAIFRVPGAELADLAEPGASLHDFRWQHALAAGRRLFADDFPSDTSVFLIEAGSLAFGLELSAPVIAAAHSVLRQIRAEIAAYAPPPLAAPALAAPAQIRIARGNLYLSRELCDAYLPNAVSVALLLRGEHILILPLQAQSAGGLLLKQRNARGDRVIHAQEFLRAKGLSEDPEPAASPVIWSPESAALVVQGYAW